MPFRTQKLASVVLPSLLLLTAVSSAVSSQAAVTPRAVLPDAILDLRTSTGAARARADWRYRDTRIAEIDHRDAGPDLKATGPANRTFDFTPDARAADFDDADWEKVAPDALEQRRGHGRLSLGWYRLRVTIPEKLAGFDPRGATVVLEVVVDDYAEVWVNGKASYPLGQSGGSVAAGWNAPNRVTLTRNAQPGDQFTIAILAVNGPLSAHPDTYLWVRGATLDFYAPSKLNRLLEAPLEVERKRDELTDIVPPWAKLYKLADGFTFTEGPLWVPDDGGYLLFSDPNNNLIYRLGHDGEVQPYLTKSGYAGEDIGAYGQPGSNGLALDDQGRLTICQHGHRRVVRLEKNGRTTVLADRWEGRRLNSPNDLAYRSDGTLFFTDPPFGLPHHHADARRELSHYGVYSVREGQIRLINTNLTGPNGLAFSPDERFLYVGNWDVNHKVVQRHPVRPDGTLGDGSVFCDLTGAPGEDAIDGIKVDQRGNVYVSGPGGLWIFASTGRHLGTLRGPEHIHNMAWGGSDRRTLYLAARTSIYSVRLGVPGAGASIARTTARR